jgi:hypothetical protein
MQGIASMRAAVAKLLQRTIMQARAAWLTFLWEASTGVVCVVMARFLRSDVASASTSCRTFKDAL